MLDFKAILENELVMMRPLVADDFDALFTISSDPLLWEQHPAKERSTRPGFEKWFEEAMATDKAFLIIEKSSGKAVGTSRYKQVEGKPDTIEIGWTFISREFWGKGYNGAVKKLMIAHAYQQYSTILFFVDKQNYRSQKAVEKLGAIRIFDPSFGERAEKSFIYRMEKTP